MRFVLALLFAAALPAFAETVSGIVLDPAGAVVPGARLTLSRASQQSAGSTESGADGRFQFPGVLPGSYVLTAEKASFTSSRTAVRIENGKAVDLTVRLSIQTFSSEVTVKERS